jgi:SAM-dependent methyltransferase
VLNFGQRILTQDVVTSKDILEVGSLNINGSLRSHCMELSCNSYTGIDICAGAGVDQVVDACNLQATFGDNIFDLVIATEMLEHVFEWRKAVNNMKSVCRPGGFILITTRSPGFPLHNCPDFWRFTISDLSGIFSDCMIRELSRDEQVPGVFIFAEKPVNFTSADLNQINPQALEGESK